MKKEVNMKYKCQIYIHLRHDVLASERPFFNQFKIRHSGHFNKTFNNCSSIDVMRFN